jgi:tetrapyrrole methylase family protein/MazG family protein
MNPVLTLVGLGPGQADDITRRAWRALESARIVFLRTARHPCVPDLPAGPEYRPLDALYAAHDRFEDVYTAIVAAVLAEAPHGGVVYAVPGDPAVGEAAVLRLRQAAPALGIEVQLVHGLSYLEPSFAALEHDPMNGVYLGDALDVARAHHPPFPPDAPALLAQMYDRQIASDLKLTLMNQYPPEHEVVVVHAAGMPDAVYERVPLYALDRDDRAAHLTSVYIPPITRAGGFEAFQEVIAHLRAPDGCPWDRKQTHLSLRKYLIEETYEVLDAIEDEDPAALAEELGDLLLQIGLHAQIAVDEGEFFMHDVIATLNEKLIRRHPHVWPPTGGAPGDAVETPAAVVGQWEQIKRQEREAAGTVRASLLDGVPRALPALLQAAEYTAAAAKPGFDWLRVEDVIAKVREEIDEVLSATDDAHRAEEMGDLLFVIVNWARWHRIDPELALRAANAKFYRRFRHIEHAAEAQGRPLNTLSLAEMDALWDEAKAGGL